MQDVQITLQQEQQPFGYVTFEPSTGALTGCYYQVLHPDHAQNHIPADEATRSEWVRYRANAAHDGLEPAPPAEPPTVVPRSVTRRQARQALLLAGLLDQVPEAIADIPDEMQRRLAEIEWADSQEFLRDRPLVIQIGAALGLDAAGLDQMFIDAAAL